MSITIKTHGEYYYKQENLKGRKPFEFSVRAPNLEYFYKRESRYIGTENVNGKEVAKFRESSYFNVRGMLKRKILPQLLKIKFSDFISVRSVTIDEIVDDAGKTLDLPVPLMNRNQLIQYCRDHKLPIEGATYMDIDELRSDIAEYEIDPTMFTSTQEKRNKRRSDEREFMRLNAEALGVTTPTASEPTKLVDPKPAVEAPSVPGEVRGILADGKDEL
jgi:hypothetical protein